MQTAHKRLIVLYHNLVNIMMKRKIILAMFQEVISYTRKYSAELFHCGYV